MKRKRSNGKRIIAGVVCFAVVFAAVFFGVQFFTKTGIFRIPGVVYYDETLTAAEIATLSEIFTEKVDLDKDVYISAQEGWTLPDLSEGEFLYSIFVPVGDFYGVDDENYTLVDVSELDFTKRLVRVDGEYYLDTFKSGAVFRILKFKSEKYNEEIKPLVYDILMARAKEFPSSDSVMTFAQTGVTAFSRLMNEKMLEVGNGEYFAAGLADYLSAFDFTHTSNEASFSDYAPTSGATGTPICSDRRFIDTLKAIGLDIVELTGNHNLDCGTEAALETIDIYEENGISVVGGGRNATEAAIPLEFSAKGSSVTMLAFNLSTGGATYGVTPGANQYYEEAAAAQITEAKAKGDFVIVDMQYYECSMYVDDGEDTTCDYANSSAGDQIGMFRHLIDLGADVVVGTSAHQPQTYELYGDGVIYYGLGNLFFDQYRWPGTTRSLILVHHIYKDRLLQTEIVPTVYDRTFQTQLMDPETRAWYLARLASERP